MSIEDGKLDLTIMVPKRVINFQTGEFDFTIELPDPTREIQVRYTDDAVTFLGDLVRDEPDE